MGNKKNNNDNQKTELEQLNLDSQYLKTSSSKLPINLSTTVLCLLAVVGLTLRIEYLSDICILTMFVLPFFQMFSNNDKTINVKYGDNKATLCINHKNYDIYVSQVNRIEYELIKQETSNRLGKKDYLYSHKIKIYYGSQDFSETLKLQDCFFPTEKFEEFKNSQFDYLFKFLTSKHGGRVVSCVDGHMPILEEYKANAKGDFLPCISCYADKYQCHNDKFPYQCHDDKFPIGFCGYMTADFLSDRVVIQIPHNCFIAYYRDILAVSLKDNYFMLQYKNTINFKIHIVGNFDSAEKIVKQLQDKIKEYYI